MMAIFPGFLFRKCYYRGEFTKQFSQSNEFDKLLWNVFFSGVSIGITFLTIYFFRSLSGLEVLGSLSYDTINQIASPISDNRIPDKDVIYKTYKDLIFIISLLYSFSCFFGLTLHWLVRTLQLDIYFPLFRFKNYWYYYIHGGKILYSSPSNKKLAFTVIDVMCEISGETKLYSGILSQYTINPEDNNLENIFLTSTTLLKQVKDDNGNTTEVKRRDIPGATFCLPYKNVANMNLIYVYRDDNEINFKKFYRIITNILLFLFATFVIVSLWFDLSSYGIEGFWRKAGYTWWSYLGLANLRLLIYNDNTNKNAWISQILFLITSILWLSNYLCSLSLWFAIIALVLAIITAAIESKNSERNDNQ